MEVFNRNNILNNSREIPGFFYFTGVNYVHNHNWFAG